MLRVYCIAICLFSLSYSGFSQQKDHTAEEMEFLAIVRRTPEYRHLKQEIDSLNKDTTQVPQELSLTIKRTIVFDKSDPNFFNAVLIRRYSIPLPSLETYEIKYDRNKRKIISFNKADAKAKIN